MRPADIFLIPYFWPIFANFRKEADRLSVNKLIDWDPKWLFLRYDLILSLYCRIQVKFLRSMQWSLFYVSLNVLYTLFWLNRYTDLIWSWAEEK